MGDLLLRWEVAHVVSKPAMLPTGKEGILVYIVGRFISSPVCSAVLIALKMWLFCPTLQNGETCRLIRRCLLILRHRSGDVSEFHHEF
jgi:hypothetical protein